MLDPSSDPAVRSAVQSASVTPGVILVERGPDLIFASGPSSPVDYQFSIRVADGESISGARLTDVVPDGFVITSISAPGGTVLSPVPLSGGPGDTVVVDFPLLVGTTDVVITGYANDVDSLGTDLIDPVSGGSVELFDSPTLSGANLVGFGPVADPVVDPTRLRATSLFIQEAITDVDGGSLVPGDLLDVCLDVAVSDYFSYAFDAVGGDVSSALADGLSFVSGSTTGAATFVSETPGGAADDIVVHELTAASLAGPGTESFCFQVEVDESYDSGYQLARRHHPAHRAHPAGHCGGGQQHQRQRGPESRR